MWRSLNRFLQQIINRQIHFATHVLRQQRALIIAALPITAFVDRNRDNIISVEVAAIHYFPAEPLPKGPGQ